MKILLCISLLFLFSCAPMNKEKEITHLNTPEISVIDTFSTKKYPLKGGGSILVSTIYNRDEKRGSTPIRYVHNEIDTLLSEYGTILIDSIHHKEFLETKVIPFDNYLWSANFRNVYDFDDYFILEERAGSNIYFDVYKKEPLEQILGGGYRFVVDTTNQIVLFQTAYDYYKQIDELSDECEFMIFDVMREKFYCVNDAFDNCNSPYLVGSMGYISTIEITKVTPSAIHLSFDDCKHVVKRLRVD